MDLASFLDHLRNHYVDQLQAFVAEQNGRFERGASEVKLQLAPESQLFARLYCVDFIGDSGQGHSVQELVPDNALEFDRFSVPVGLAYVSVESMGWDDVVLEHDLASLPEDELQDWFGQWFDPEDARHVPGAAMSEVIHSLLVAPNRLSIDLGTAPVDAFLAMIELLGRAGARSITVRSSRADGA